MSKWIETPNDGLINAEYITAVMPTQRSSRDSLIDYTIDISILGETNFNRINFETKEHRDSRLSDLKCFLKNSMGVGTFIFKNETEDSKNG
jgi:hypothetical protein